MDWLHQWMGEAVMGFQIGDVVELKSGGPWMTVSNTDGSDGQIGCQWFNHEGTNYELKGARFKPEVLKKKS